MKKTKITTIMIIITIFAVSLSACGAKAEVDANQKMTEIAATVQAQLTQTALHIPTATATPEPPTATFTITPAPPTSTIEGMAATETPIIFSTQPTLANGDDAKFIADISIPDGTTLRAGEQFTKTWRFQNTGKTTWTTVYAIQYLEGNLLGRNGNLTFNLPIEVPPGGTLDLSIPFTAPTNPGTYSSYWKLLSANGYYFGDPVSININVGTPTPTVPSLTPTKNPTQTPTLEVTT